MWTRSLLSFGIGLLFPFVIYSQTVTGPSVTFDTSLGPMNVTLLPTDAPLNVANFLGYVNSGAYNNSFIHRSLPGFVFQGGGFQWVNNTPVAIPTVAPVVNEYNVPNTRGTLAMALLSNSPDSATSQWFFNEVDNSGVLDTSSNGPFTVIGQVTDPASLAIMDQISAVPTFNFTGTFYDPEATGVFAAWPLMNYSGTASIATANLVLISSITQTPEACTLTPPVGGINADSTGGSAVTLSINGLSCNWTAVPSDPWIAVSSTAGNGPAAVIVSVQPNTTGIDRSGSLSIAGQTIPITERSTVQVFNDVPASAYYFDAVNLLSGLSITAGCGGNNYCPGLSVTRDDMAIFVVRTVFGSDNFSYSTTPYFGDVPATYFAFPWIQKLYELGITVGCGGTPINYCPGSTVSRDQMAIFLIRARYGASTAFTWNPKAFFADVPSNYYAFDWIQRFYQDSITGGCLLTPLSYCPEDPVVRGDMAIFLMRGGFNQLLPPTAPVIKSILPNTLTEGLTETFIITGLNTAFSRGATQLVFSPSSGITVNSITITDPATMQVSLTASPTAPIGPVSIYVQTEPQEAVLPNGLVIQ